MEPAHLANDDPDWTHPRRWWIAWLVVTLSSHPMLLLGCAQLLVSAGSPVSE